MVLNSRSVAIKEGVTSVALNKKAQSLLDSEQEQCAEFGDNIMRYKERIEYFDICLKKRKEVSSLSQLESNDKPAQKKLQTHLTVQTKNSNSHHRWHEIRSKEQGPSTRSHFISFMYND